MRIAYYLVIMHLPMFCSTGIGMYGQGGESTANFPPGSNARREGGGVKPGQG